MARSNLPANPWEFGLEPDGHDDSRLQKLQEDTYIDMMSERAVAYKNRLAARLMGDVAEECYTNFHETTEAIASEVEGSSKKAAPDNLAMAKQTVQTLRQDLGGLQKVADYHLTELANRSVHPGARPKRSALRRFWEDF
ncbi:hypothetical protein [Nitrolancea hollandica]|uniref:Uncharacterized protein n=1 Tax=Nitrolancea hollandica Lb TaxID=1129897 RepID=I4ELA9_9BACT|nr:hypothetical protein [Nitrolancea hollandica]CCF85471.1 hypothetical protein NITHO_500006 [Nitrolancea hollandica Lb]